MTDQVTRPPKVQQRREELTVVAARLFRDRGYDATTMQEVADEMGILKGSVYHYVKTKEDLLWMVVEIPLRELVENARVIFATQGESLTARLTEVMRAHAVSFERHFPHMFVLTRENGETLSPERRAEFDKLRDEYFALYRHAVQEGIETGELRADLDPVVVTHAIFGMLNWMFRWFTPARRSDAGLIAKGFGEILVGGIRFDQRESAGFGSTGP